MLRLINKTQILFCLGLIVATQYLFFPLVLQSKESKQKSALKAGLNYNDYLKEVEKSLDAIKVNKLKVEELFSTVQSPSSLHQPVKLEAAVSEPVFYNLQELLAMSVENNLNYLIQEQSAKEAKWKLWSRYADLLPDFSLNAQTRNIDGTFYLNSNVQAPIDERVSGAGMRFDYRAFDGGTKTFLALAERFYRKSADEMLQDQFNQVVLSTMGFYYSLVTAQSALSARLEAVKQSDLNLKIANDRFSSGVGTKFDVIQAEARLARAQQSLIESETEYRIAQINLTEHLNLPLLTPINISYDSLSSLKLIDESMQIEDFLAISKEKNPKIKSRLALKKGAVREGLSKLGDFLPDLDLYADFSASGEEFSDLFGVTTLGAQVNYGIGQGLGVKHVAEIMEAKAQVEKAKLEYLKEEQTIEKDLRLAFIDYQKSKSIVTAANKELEAAKESLRISRLRYENGIEIFTNLVEKETELADAEVNLFESFTDFNLAQLKLLYQMGEIQIEELLKS